MNQQVPAVCLGIMDSSLTVEKQVEFGGLLDQVSTRSNELGSPRGRREGWTYAAIWKERR